MSADELKAKGNAAFTAGKFNEAVELFSQAINVDPTNHVLYSNRSGSYASMELWGEAMKDAAKCVEIKPDWAKGWSRLAVAKHGLSDLKGACEAYRAALKLEPTSRAYQDGLASAEAELLSVLPEEEREILTAFRSPKFAAAVLQNPETRGFLDQQDFLVKLREIQEDPMALQRHVSDARIAKVMELILGVKVMSKEAAAKERMKEMEEEMKRKEEQEERRKREEAERKRKEEEEEARRREAQLSPEEKELRARKDRAVAEKEKGNEAYKARRFEEALVHYNAAMEIDPSDISFINNRAAVYLEMGQLDKCIEDCDTAVDRGRELRSDYKLIARAMTRKGTALVKKGDLERAAEVFNKSLMEHRNPDTLKRLQETEKALKDKKETEYVDLELSGRAREDGNASFKAQKYAEAIGHYTEAIKRGPPGKNPEAYKLFSNRSACYSKLGAMPEALKDAEKCIELEPTFAKGYLRKGQAQYFMKEYEKALDSYQAGLDHDPENDELRDGAFKAMEAINRFMSGQASDDELAARREKAMADPEIQAILTDPIMRNVLRDFQENPRAAQQHLKDPVISMKLSKLVRNGVVRLS